MASVALRLPTPCGLKTTEIIQLDPIATALPQPLLSTLKSDAFAPEILAESIKKGAVPRLVTDTVKAGLLVPVF
jgi:hypothetical protein